MKIKPETEKINICSQCGCHSIARGTRTFDSIDKLTWLRCNLCGWGYAFVTLLDVPIETTFSLLKQYSLSDKDAGLLSEKISLVYDRDPDWQVPVHCEVPWTHISRAKTMVEQTLEVPPNPNARSEEILPRFKIRAGYLVTAKCEERSQDAGVDAITNFYAHLNVNAIWPLRVLDAMGLIHFGDEIWRKQ